MYDDHAANAPSENSASPFDLVAATESGRMFTVVAGFFLRACGVLGCLVPLGALLVLSELHNASGLTMMTAFLLVPASIIGAVLSWKVLFARARRMNDIPETGNAAVSVFREVVRAGAESAFCWAMTAGVFSVFFAATQSYRFGIEQMLTACATAAAVAAFGWFFLLYTHMLTGIFSALTAIADNTAVMAKNGTKEKWP